MPHAGSTLYYSVADVSDILSTSYSCSHPITSLSLASLQAPTIQQLTPDDWHSPGRRSVSTTIVDTRLMSTSSTPGTSLEMRCLILAASPGQRSRVSVNLLQEQ